MSTQRTVKQQAADGKVGMTLAELARFVREAEAEGIGQDTRVRVVANWRSGIRSLEVQDTDVQPSNLSRDHA